MSATSIRSRRVQPLPPPIDPDFGIKPRGAVKERAVADDSNLTPEQPTASLPIVPADTAAPSPSRRTSESPSMPATSSMDDIDLIYALGNPRVGIADPDEVALRSVVEPLGRDRKTGVMSPEYELKDLRNTPAQDKNGRLKSAIWNFVREMSGQARRVSASGQPVDEYRLASVVGAGIGGGFAGGINPRVDEDIKRRMRMADLEGQIAQQLEIEKQQAVINETNARAEGIRARPDIEEANRRARSKPPKGYVMAGKRIEFRRPEGWDPETGDLSDWEPYEATVDGKPLVDTSKVPNEQGLLPRDVQRKQLAEANNKFKAAENQKDRDFKAVENEKDRGIKRAQLREQIRAHLEAEKQRRAGLGQGAQRIRISLANARVQAERYGVSLNEYIDSLTDNDVEVYDK